MGKSFDIGLEMLTGAGVPVSGDGQPQEGGLKPPLQVADGAESTFYLETFGCQMNDHDSEKVAGVLVARGYRQVDGPEAAKVILYNTCSIREKAAQKVFSRLGELRPMASDQRPVASEEREPNAETQRTQSSEEKRNPRAQAGAPVPREANHPSLRKIVNAAGG